MFTNWYYTDWYTHMQTSNTMKKYLEFTSC